MKSYEDIAERVFEKGDEILKARQKRTAIIRKTSFILSEICAVVLICFSVWKIGDMQITPDCNFPDTIITESESTADFNAPVSTSENNKNDVYTPETNTVSETDMNPTVFQTESSPSDTILNAPVSNKIDTETSISAAENRPDQTEQIQTPLQTSVSAAEIKPQQTIQIQTTFQTGLKTTDIPIQTTVCTTIQTENEGSYYMKKLAAFATSAIVIASSATPIIGNAEYKVNEGRFHPGEKAMFAQMDSGELDADINGDGVVDVMDGLKLCRYLEEHESMFYSRDLEDIIKDIYEENSGALATAEKEEKEVRRNYEIWINELSRVDIDDATEMRIESIADYNGDGVINHEDKKHLIRYLIVSKKVTREHLEATFYNPDFYETFDFKILGYYPSSVNIIFQYINGYEGLRNQMRFLLAGYDIVAEMYETQGEDWSIDIDFNGNGQLDIGDVYVYYVFYEEKCEDRLGIKNPNGYISDEEWDRCEKIDYAYPDSYLYMSDSDRYYFLYYLTHYIVGHIEMKSEYCTEEYYAETYGDKYFRAESGIISARVRHAAEYMGVKPVEKAEYKLDESRFHPGEKAIFAQMDSGELNVDIDGNGEFNEMDGFMLHCYNFDRVDNTFHRPQTYYTFDNETIARINAIADYNGDGKIDSQDNDLIERYLFVSRNVKREHLDLTHYDPDYIVDEEDSHPYGNAVFSYVMGLREKMKNLLAGYDIVEEMYEDGTIDLDFNGNGQLDVGDTYTLNVFYNLYKEQDKDFNDIEYIENRYISEEEWNRCNEAMSHYPHKNDYYPILSGYYERNDSIYYLLFYSSRYIAAHTELKSEYFTEEYYAETYGDNYYCPERWWTHAIVRQAAESMGVKPDSDAWIKYNRDDLDKLFVLYCRDVENGLRPAPDVNMDGVVNLDDYFAVNTYMVDLIANKTVDNTRLPAEVWENIIENYDINENGTTKDIYDILMVQMYVVKYTDTSNFDAAYQKHLESLGETSVVEIESVSYDKQVEILADIESKTISGDANCDSRVEIADATLILQYLTNKDEYKLTAQGMINADCCNVGDGVTAQDALAIQMLDAGVIESLPTTIK